MSCTKVAHLTSQQLMKARTPGIKKRDIETKIKLEMNNHTGSKIREIKEYTSY